MNKIKIGIDNFLHGNPIDNCSDFRLDNHDGWNEYPCHTGFVIQWFLNNTDLYEYVDTRKEDSFIYPINFKCFVNALGISNVDMWNDKLNSKKTFLNLIPNHVLDGVRNNKIKILLNYGFEGHPKEKRDTILYLESFLIEKLKEKNLPIDNVYYTDANYNLDGLELDIKTFSHNYTANCFYISEGEVGSNINHFKLTDKQIEKKKKQKLTKKYICYNRLKKWHRERVVNWIKENGYLEDGYVSFPPNLILDYTNFDDNWAYHKICTDHCDTSFFSIINEANYGYQECFLTEKTWKSIFNFHPFIIVGSPNSLKYLKERGFDIFEDIFDSSYDDIYDGTERLQRIFDILDDFLKTNSILELQKIREDIFPRLLHNYNHFWSNFCDYISKDFNDKMRKINGNTKI